MTAVGQTGTHGILLQIPDVGISRRNAQRHVGVVSQLFLLENNGVTLLLRLIGVCT
ncbi:Uncharacterised protein [Enterobacter cloacae]|nr:Uncharacterised protein [Enterobacter cloacae]